jgi:thiamine-phosphate pyrophosphorylase
MKIRVITHPTPLANEAMIVNSLFEAGLEWLHLRKPDLPVNIYDTLLQSVHTSFRKRIILHAHHALANIYEVGGVHLTEMHRNSFSGEKLAAYIEQKHQQGQQVGTAVHAKATLSTLIPTLDYVLVSPVFESISKTNYKPVEHWNVQQLKSQVPFTLVGLGGIEVEKLAAAAELGFTEVAVLGTIWNNPARAVAQFQSLQEQAKQHY